MSFISYPRGGASAVTATDRPPPLPLTSSGAMRLIEDRHLIHVATLGSMVLDLAATDPDQLVLTMHAQGRYVLDAIVLHDLRRGHRGDATITIATMDAARGGGDRLADAVPLAPLADRAALIRIIPAVEAIREATHLYITLGGTGSGTVLVRVLGTVVAPEDPDHPDYDRRRLPFTMPASA